MCRYSEGSVGTVRSTTRRSDLAEDESYWWTIRTVAVRGFLAPSASLKLTEDQAEM